MTLRREFSSRQARALGALAAAVFAAACTTERDPTDGSSRTGVDAGHHTDAGPISSDDCGTLGLPCCAGGTCASSATCVASTCVSNTNPDLGRPCERNSDCSNSNCYPAGQPAGGDQHWTGNVCTSFCSTNSDCVPGWSCSTELGTTQNICICHYHPEVCNGLDDDCNGIVDDEPTVDKGCAEKLGGASVCQNKTCQCPTTLCDGKCVDTTSDPMNCGRCDLSCAVGASCESSECICPGAEQACSGTCTNTDTDVVNCGGCDMPCPSGSSCKSGNCGCPQGEIVCDDSCVDTDSDNANCGDCGIACPSGSVCQSSHCVCGNGFDECNGQCVSTSSDDSNCGGCGAVCPHGTSCSGGQCCGSSGCHAGNYVGCSTNSDCASKNCATWNVGSPAVCLTSCTSNSACAQGQICVTNLLAGNQCLSKCTSVADCPQGIACRTVLGSTGQYCVP